ncbi:YkvA family protein [Nitrosomonas communis]|uniref:Uncharacterized membrane protein YkvA, DUF1232 family n=1 Tax=Nitrosomonas communis TaxID=44574 RepID=A0A1I4XEH8_9PROT|nr:YkvA family protein [Nitrosomonas communis]SFN24308.1 Uncharacterized membrane protein YkvA, DUF1232 family [Nitrosomonas communis]
MIWLENLKDRAQILKIETYALYLAARDPRTPWYAKLLVTGVVAYALSPIDLIPDFIPILGYLDDLILVPLGIALAIKLIPRTILEECQIQAKEIMIKKPVSWSAGAVIIAIWLILAVPCIIWLYEFIA